MGEIVKKEEVEELLKSKITDRQFQLALRYARKKQEYIYGQEHRPVVLQHWYLVCLTEEYVRNLAFSDFTMALCGMMRNMEKEHLVKNQDALTDIHIVAVFL